MFRRVWTHSAYIPGPSAYIPASKFLWGIYGAWTQITDPRAVYSATYNKTYFGGVSIDGTIWVACFDHSFNSLSSTNLHVEFEYDSHAAPSILIRNDGRLIVFYTKHTGTTLYYRISTNPGDISSFETEQTLVLGDVITYTEPCTLSGEANKIYLFFRGPNTNSWSYITSTDSGNNWSEVQLLFTIADTTNQYLKVASNGVDKIYFTHSGHPGLETSSIYAFYYYNGHFYKSDGTLIETPMPFTRSDMTLVYDATAEGNYRGWPYDIAVMAGVPHIVFAIYVSDADHRYLYATYSEADWVYHEITTAGGDFGLGAPGGICIDHNDPTTIYLAKVVNGQWEIQKGRTSDGGITWTLTPVTNSSVKKNFQPVVPRNSHSDLPVLWMVGDYPSWLSYVTYITSPLDQYPVGYDKIAVTAPNGGEIVYRGANYNITWTYELCIGVTNVKIELLKAGVTVSTIVESTSLADGTYAWTVPSDIEISSDYTIKIITL